MGQCKLHEGLISEDPLLKCAQEVWDNEQVAEMIHKPTKVRFCDLIEFTFAPNYDRRVDTPWTRLTLDEKVIFFDQLICLDYPQVAILEELNELKKEMEVHADSHQHTR